MQAPPVKDGPRMNQDIRAPRVLLIDQNVAVLDDLPAFVNIVTNKVDKSRYKCPYLC
mgnify:CR=1 FL=1